MSDSAGIPSQVSPGTSPGDFVSTGLIRAKDTLLEIFQGSNIYLIIFLILLFLGIAFYVYTNYISPIIQPGYVGNNELNENDDENKDDWSMSPEDEDGMGPQGTGSGSGSGSSEDPASQDKVMTLWYFYTDWCPYCKKAKPQLDQLKSLYPDSTVKENFYSLKFQEINGETGANQVKWFEKTYLKDSEKKEIDGYPSIYLVKDSEVFEYEATPKLETFQEFIRQVAYNYKE